MTEKAKSLIFHWCWIVGLIATVLLTSCSDTVSRNVHLKYGNPSQAGSQLNNYLIERPQFALSYNCSAGIANWASWELDRNWLGKVDRSNDFRPDLDLPEGCYAARPSDYRGSGYDRGHLVPSGDRTRRQDDNSVTFIMSNIIPQAPENNREVWRELEEHCRDLVFQGKELYIVAGGSNIARSIAKDKIAVPEYNWKVILVLKQSQNDVTVDNARTIAVWIPNNAKVGRTDWKDYLVTVNAIEKRTGYDFFNRLPKRVQRQIEQ